MRVSRGCVQATVQVPEDALVADFVFLDCANEQTGFYDNNNGLDYHVPVVGAQGTLPPLRIAHVSVEMAPIAKVGGMGDVVTALGRAVQEYGHEVEVLLCCLPTRMQCTHARLLAPAADAAAEPQWRSHWDASSRG
jgi:Starch synthase catalytic domain/Starch/carbohydrate-binding module (family 53)